MKLKRIFAVILCLLLVFVTVTACKDDDDNGEYPYNNGENGENVNNGDPGDSSSPVEGFDFDAAIAAFAPETVMIKAGNLTLNWAEFYTFLFRAIISLSGPEGIDWDTEAYDGMSMSDMILDFTTDDALAFLVIRHGVESLNFEMSNTDAEALYDQLDDLIEMYGGVAELEVSLRENYGFYNFDFFVDFIITEVTAELLFNHLYGEWAVDLSDAKASEYAAENGYMMALHILRMKTEEDDDTPLNEAKEILKELNDNLDADDFTEFFKELMFEKSEDMGGVMSFPDGYLFQFKDMMEPFSEAAMNLEPGEISDITETLYGYHIILRIPIDYDAVPIALSSMGMYHSLRMLAAFEDFELQQNIWYDELDIEYTAEYESLDLSKIFKWR